MKTLTLTLALMMAGLTAFAAPIQDRRLSKSEMARLLPLYVQQIESTATTIPTAGDNSSLEAISSFAGDHLYLAFDANNKIIGNQSHTLATIIEGLESSLAEIKAKTPAERTEETANLLEGFKGSKEGGKISCRLGYLYETKGATDRIVTCTDNRSEASGGENDEGSYDVRTIILSIDAATLEPIAVLRLRHDIAG